MRKEFKKVVALTAAAATLVGATATAFAFTDTDTHWAKDYIDYAAASGWVNGYEDNTFRPDNNVTRAEVAQILVNMYDVTETTDQVLTDVSDSAWYADAAKKAVAAGYFQGDDNEDGTVVFRPEDDLTRQEAFVLIKRAAYPDEVATSTNLPFTDADSVASWAVIATSTLVEIGRLNGYEDNTLRPLNNITRAELTKLLATVTDSTPATPLSDITNPTNTNTGTSSLIGSGSSSRRSGGGGGGTTTVVVTVTSSPSAAATEAPNATEAPADATPTPEPTATPEPPATQDEINAIPEISETGASADVVGTAADNTKPAEYFNNLSVSPVLASALQKAGITSVPSNNATYNVAKSGLTEEAKTKDIDPILTPVYAYVQKKAKEADPVIILEADKDNLNAIIITYVDAVANKVCEVAKDAKDIADFTAKMQSYVVNDLYASIDERYANGEQNANVKKVVSAVVKDIFFGDSNAVASSASATNMTTAVYNTAEADKISWLTLREAFLKAKGSFDETSETEYLKNYTGITSVADVLVESK